MILPEGHAGGEHALHEHGDEDPDCEDCIAQQREATHVTEMMFLLVGVSLAMLLVWWMMVRCKKHGMEVETKV